MESQKRDRSWNRMFIQLEFSSQRLHIISIDYVTYNWLFCQSRTKRFYFRIVCVSSSAPLSPNYIAQPNNGQDSGGLVGNAHISSVATHARPVPSTVIATCSWDHRGLLSHEMEKTGRPRWYIMPKKCLCFEIIGERDGNSRNNKCRFKRMLRNGGRYREIEVYDREAIDQNAPAAAVAGHFGAPKKCWWILFKDTAHYQFFPINPGRLMECRYSCAAKTQICLKASRLRRMLLHKVAALSLFLFNGQTYEKHKRRSIDSEYTSGTHTKPSHKFCFQIIGGMEVGTNLRGIRRPTTGPSHHPCFPVKSDSSNLSTNVHFGWASHLLSW